MAAATFTVQSLRLFLLTHKALPETYFAMALNFALRRIRATPARAALPALASAFHSTPPAAWKFDKARHPVPRITLRELR